jgi:hypothetical protein
MNHALLVLSGLLPLALPLRQEQDPASEAKAALARTLEQEGILLDLDIGAAAIPAAVLVRDDLLEYLLVGPNGASHESLFLTETRPSLLNAALLALGVEPGTNARWEPVAGTEGEHRALPPEGDGFLLYIAWREGEEVYFYRLDDLLSNLATGRSMRRHRWVFLGSRFKSLKEGEPEEFVADLEGNLVNITFFFQGNTLLTAALPDCLEQTIWVANPWLLPPRESQVQLVFAREPLSDLPAAWKSQLSEVVRAEEPEEDDAR